LTICRLSIKNFGSVFTSIHTRREALMGWDDNLENTRDEVEGQVMEHFGQATGNEQTTDNEQSQSESGYDQGGSSYGQDSEPDDSGYTED
jgi:uncharacterized protein YjbJ (UPF0337 family)